MKSFIVFSFLLISLLFSNSFGQLPDKFISEIYKKNQNNVLVSPGFEKEILIGSTFMNGYLYVGTTPNAHIYEIDPNTNKIVKDFGPAGIDLTYDAKTVWELTNNGQ